MIDFHIINLTIASNGTQHIDMSTTFFNENNMLCKVVLLSSASLLNACTSDKQKHKADFIPDKITFWDDVKKGANIFYLHIKTLYGRRKRFSKTT